MMNEYTNLKILNILADITINNNNLTPREELLLKMRLRGCALGDAGKELGVTRERIRAIEYRILQKIKIEKKDWKMI